MNQEITFEENIQSEILSDQFDYALRQCGIEANEIDVSKSEYADCFHASLFLSKYGVVLNNDLAGLEEYGFKFLALGGLNERMMLEFLVIE